MFLAMTKLVIGKISDYEEGKLIHVTAGGKEIVTTKIGDRYYAMNNICNHAGAELHEGKLSCAVLRGGGGGNAASLPG